jgi:hypothetical protein
MNRILALILSLVYCGLGQIYKGKVLKGINLAIIYTTLVLSLIFLSSISQLALLILIFLLILMWLTGMLDAYADENTFIIGNHGLLWNTLIMVLIAVGISGSVVTVTVLIVQPQVFALGFGNMTTHVTSDNKATKDLSQIKPMGTEKSNLVLQGDTSQNQVPKANTSDSIQENLVQVSNDTKDISSKIKEGVKSEKASYYSIQAGAFSESERAESLAKQLREKGYSIHIISPSPDESPELYKVLVGKFDNEDIVTRTAEKLNKYGDITGVAVLVTQSQ